MDINIYEKQAIDAEGKNIPETHLWDTHLVQHYNKGIQCHDSVTLEL